TKDGARSYRPLDLRRSRHICRAQSRPMARYFPGQIAWLGPREQPRLATEFVSPVRARGGRLAGLVEAPARNATWANVGGPVANGRGP
ncbi:MAG TPA: hypothetical protein VF777_04190, partial [Phycisphaerales bacterium]